MSYQWGFVIAAYVVGIAPVGGLVLLSWIAMRRAEGRATPPEGDRP